MAPRSLHRAHGSLIGRTTEVKQLRAIIETSRLVTLVGPGGVGKTAIAAELGHELEPDFERVALVELLDVASGSELLTQVTTQALDDLPIDADGLAAGLDSTPTLMIIDNCEHVVDAVADLIGSLLDQTVDLRVVATSRRPLDIGNEVTFSVAPLDVTATDEASPAAALFIERARQARPTFEVDDGAVIDRICEAADGVPLVIELAAALVRTRSVEAIASSMSDLESLASRRRDLPEHHRTIAASLDWSRRFLSPEDTTLLDQLSVFVGGFTLEGASRVAGPGAAAGVSRLVDHSLVVYDTATDRYRLLEVVRLDAESNLSADQRHEVTSRHFAWCVELVDVIDEGRVSPDPDDLFAGHTAEMPNLTAAARRCLESEDDEGFRRLIGPIAVWWIHHTPPEDASTWIGRFEGTGAPAAWRANVLSALAFHWSHQGKTTRSLEVAQRARLLHAEAADPVGDAITTMCIGNAHVELGDTAMARAAYEEALSVALSSGNDYPELLARVALARFDHAHPDARGHLLRALEIVGDGYASVEPIVNAELAVVALSAGETKLARRYADAAVETSKATDYGEAKATALCSLGEVATAQTDNATATTAFEQALELGRRVSHTGIIRRAEAGLSTLPAQTTSVSTELSERELAVARLLRGDLTQREIADELYIAPSTVKTHTKSIYRKLGVSKRSHAVSRAIELGLF